MALRELGGSVGVATAARDLVLVVETGDVDVLKAMMARP